MDKLKSPIICSKWTGIERRRRDTFSLNAVSIWISKIIEKKEIFYLSRLPEAEQVLVTDDAAHVDGGAITTVDVIDRNFGESAPFARSLLSRIYWYVRPSPTGIDIVFQQN